MTKVLNVQVTIQLDKVDSDKTDVDYVLDLLDEFNTILLENFDSQCPQILTEAVDKHDISEQKEV